MFTSHLFLNTWMGSKDQHAALFTPRILMLGVSPYGGGAQNTDVQLREVETINGDFPLTFYTPLALVFFEDKNAHSLTLGAKQLFWNGMLPSPFLQTHLEGARQAPSATMWENVMGAFYALLEAVRTHLLLVSGFRLWEQLLKKHHLAKHLFKGVDATCNQLIVIRAYCEV